MSGAPSIQCSQNVWRAFLCALDKYQQVWLFLNRWVRVIYGIYVHILVFKQVAKKKKKCVIPIRNIFQVATLNRWISLLIPDENVIDFFFLHNFRRYTFKLQ